MAKAARTPTACPMAAIHRNARPGESAGVRTRKAAAKMPAAKTGTRAAKATATEAAMTTAATTAVAGRKRASRHRGRADCYSRNERYNFIPHYTLLTSDRPTPSSNARTTRWVAHASPHQDQMTRSALHGSNVSRLKQSDHQSSATALPCMTSARRARVARVVSSGSASGAKKPCAIISWFGCGGVLW